MVSVPSEATHCSNSDLLATHFFGLFITVIAFRALWTSDFPSAMFGLHSCLDRADRRGLCGTEICIIVHKPVGSNPALTRLMKNQQWCYLDLEPFHKQIKFAYAHILKVWGFFFLSFSFLLKAGKCLFRSAYILKWVKNCVVRDHSEIRVFWRSTKRFLPLQIMTYCFSLCSNHLFLLI